MKRKPYKCGKCGGLTHVRGKIYTEHYEFRRGHKQTHRGPYKKKDLKL